MDRPKDHEHKSAREPRALPGWAVCECGATQRVEPDGTRGQWHACVLCSWAAP